MEGNFVYKWHVTVGHHRRIVLVDDAEEVDHVQDHVVDHDQGVVRDQDREDDHINPIQDLVVVPGQIVKAHMEDLKADHVQNQENAVGHVPGLNNLKRWVSISQPSSSLIFFIISRIFQ